MTTRAQRTGLVAAAAVVVLSLNLRTLFASLPPLLGEVRADLGLSATASGLLTTGPVLCLGVVAPLAPWLARRTALERILWLGLVATAVGLAMRGRESVVWLFAGTLLAGAGVAIAQVSLPSLIRVRQPGRTGALTGVFSMAIALSGTIAAAASVPLEHALGDWPAALAFWALPAAAVCVLWALPALRARPAAAEARPHRPWRSPIGWWLGVFFGVQSTAFYATLTWLPTMLQDRGSSAREAGLLLGLVLLTSFAPAFLLPFLAARRADQRGLLAVTVALPVTGLTGLAVAPGAAPAWVALVGVGQGAALGLGLILPVLRAPDPAHVAPLLAMTQFVGYIVAAGGPWLLGFVHDVAGNWTVPHYVLLAVTALELPAGLVAARGRSPLAARDAALSRTA